jgi:hypothetical protein
MAECGHGPDEWGLVNEVSAAPYLWIFERGIEVDGGHTRNIKNMN